MKNNSNGSYSGLLLALAAAFICTRYICACILAAGSFGDSGIYEVCLERLGPFLPVMSMTCLIGSVVVSIIDVFFAAKNRKKK